MGQGPVRESSGEERGFLEIRPGIVVHEEPLS